MAFLVVRGEEAEAVNFLERRYYRGRVSSPRLASFLPLGLSASDLISLLSAAPLPAGITAARGTPSESVRDLQLAAKSTGSAALEIEGPYPARLLFGQDAELLAASLGPPGSRIEALYSGWEGFGGLRFPTRFELSEPARNCALSLDISEVRVNEPVPAASFVLEPPQGFKAVEAP